MIIKYHDWGLLSGIQKTLIIMRHYSSKTCPESFVVAVIKAKQEKLAKPWTDGRGFVGLSIDRHSKELLLAKQQLLSTKQRDTKLALIAQYPVRVNTWQITVTGNYRPLSMAIKDQALNFLASFLWSPNPKKHNEIQTSHLLRNEPNFIYNSVNLQVRYEQISEYLLMCN